MINLTVVIDNDEAIRKLRELQNVAKTTTSSVVKDSERMDETFNKIKNSIAGLVAGVSISALAKQVVEVRGEVQQLEVAFETMLGSKQKAEKLLAESIELAAKTPFGLQDVSNGAKMLLAYGSAAEEVTEEIKMLGNIASGLSIPLNDLIYLYGTTRTQGRMFTMDLRQFMGRGIPLAEELAKQFGVTKDAVGQLVADGKVGFEQMQTALRALTSEGGQFYNLMEKQSQTITGQISNLEDSIFQMFNAIGKQSEGIIGGAIDVVASLVENYERVGRTLVGLVAVYGTYKTAVMLAAAASKGYTIAELARYSALVLVEKAQKLLNATMLKNPYVLAATAVAAFVALLISQKTATERLRDAEEDYAAAKQDAIDKENEHMQSINDLIATAEDEYASTYARRDALHELIRKYPEVFAKYDTELAMLRDLKQIKLEIASIEAGKSITIPQNELEKVNARIAELEALRDQQSLYVGTGGYQPRLTRGLTKKEQAELEVLQKRRRELYGDIADAQRDNYLAGLASVSDEELAREIEQTKRALAQYKERGYISPFGDVMGGDFGSNYDPTRMEGDLQILEAEYARRQAPTMTAKDWLASKKQEWEDAEKAYNDYLSNKGQISDEEFTRESKRLKEEADSKKKAYMGYAPSGRTGRKSKSDSQAERIKKAADIYSDINAYNSDVQVELLEDGANKEIAQINRNYEKKVAEIREQEKKLTSLQGTITDEQNAALTLALENAAKVRDAEIAKVNKRSEEEAAKSMNEYLIAYGTLQEKILATQDKYATAIANAKNDGEKKMLETERDAILAEFAVEAEGFGKELVGKTTKELSTMIEQLRAQVEAKQEAFDALDSSDSTSAQAYREEINKLNAQIKVLQQQLGKANKAIKDDNWAEATQVFQNIANTANEAAEGISEYNEEAGMVLSGITQLASFGIDLIGTLQGVQKAFKATGEAASAMEKASAIIAVISLAIKAVSGIFNIMNANEEATRNATLAAYEYSQALKEIANIELRESFSAMFGKDSFGEFSALLTETQKQLQELEDTKKKLAETEESAVKNLGANTSVWGNFGGLRGKMNDAKSLDNTLVADMRSGWQKFWGTGNDNIKTTSLEEFYEDGKLNVDKLKAYYDQYKDYLTAEQADLVKSLIDTGELYEKNMDAVTEYLSNIFGELGQSISDSLLEAFKNGTDAAEAMGDVVANVIERMAQDIAYMTFIQPLLDDAEARSKAMQDLYARGLISEEEYLKRQKKNLKILEEGLAARQDELNDFYEDVGIDSSASSQSATQKGFQAMSQDTGDELNGRFTDIQGKVSGIHEAVQFMKSLGSQQLQSLTSIHATVADIRNDTTLIEQHTRVLSTMSQDLSDLKRAVVNEGLI